MLSDRIYLLTNTRRFFSEAPKGKYHEDNTKTKKKVKRYCHMAEHETSCERTASQAKNTRGQERKKKGHRPKSWMAVPVQGGDRFSLLSPIVAVESAWIVTLSSLSDDMDSEAFTCPFAGATILKAWLEQAKSAIQWSILG